MYRRLFRSFKALCRNKDKKLDEHLYKMSEKSYMENFKLVFGHDNNIIKKRFFMILTGGKR